uniref:Putative permeases n=1 Tax=uncultured bacterium Contigcl_1523 TaxID=1393648 RepID=W0FSL6_9BACT|nr:putative permeases [uncultured bacterium Contigcl_1523]
MNAFSVTFGNVLLTLLYLSAGFLLSRAKLVKAAHISSVSAILLYLCGPCMFIGAIMEQDVSADLNRAMFWFFLVVLAAQLLFMLLIWLLLGKRRKTFSGRMASIASVMGNAGFFGLPIIRSLFPDVPEVAAFSCIYCVAMNILAWTLGIFVLTNDRKYISLKAAFLNPTVVSVAFALVLYLLKAKSWMPDLLQSGIRSVGGISTPLCMILLGVRLSAMKASTLFTRKVAWFTIMSKMVVFPLFSYLLVLFLPLSDVFKGSILILGATPCASVILNLSEIHQSGRELAADCTLLSTLLSIATIPLLSLLL